MNKDNINTVCHRWLKDFLQGGHICVDATCGNGNDTLFLAERTKKVYAFDIQKQAIDNTKKRCTHLENIQLFELSHAKMESVIHEKVDCVVFNFGYLPKADPTLITQTATSLEAVKAAWRLLNENGVLALSCYVGHAGGAEETEAIHRWIDENALPIVLTYRQDRPASPILTILQKKSV